MADLEKEAQEFSLQRETPELTIDALVQIFALTLGSLKGAGGMTIWSWVNYSEMSTDPFSQAKITYYFAAWFLILICIKVLAFLNYAFVDEWKMNDWRLNPQTDTVVITGGSSGLGLLLTAVFSANNFTVHNIDISKPELSVSQASFLQCDISDNAQVAKCVAQIADKPAILINCAAIANGSLGEFEHLETENIAKVISTNTLGSMYSTHAMLKYHKDSFKMVVGISSSTALCGPAYSGVYASSKAAVRTFYESLRHELRPRIRVLYITPGQLDTRMFASIETPSDFLSPVVSAVDLASSIFNAVVKGRQGEVSMPFYAKLLPYALCLPQSIIDIMRAVIGIDDAAKGQK